MTQTSSRLKQLQDPAAMATLRQIRRGIEKESLRVTPDGSLALTPHPAVLGSTLTHDTITTDYSEALLEFITPPVTDIAQTLQTLEDIHSFVYQHIGEERLWVNSMPCVLGKDGDIPVARYGSSNVGKMKTVYRLGLGLRYGRKMQTIAGIHYNFSLPDALWEILRAQEAPNRSLQQFKTEGYFGLIRNFRRTFWLLIYLFGASPAICRSFVAGREHRLLPFGEDDHSLHLPYGTALRMGNLGYQSDNQSSLFVCYNNLANYIKTIRGGLMTPYPAYESFGLCDGEGNYHQLSTHLLQIENEFYSPIRPKRPVQSGETPVAALWERGVEYIEVRCLDLNPFLANGIDAQTMRFIDIFLLHCLITDSPECEPSENTEILANQQRVVTQGRDPLLALVRNERSIALREWAEALFSEMQPLAVMLDEANGGEAYQTALHGVKATFDDPAQLPSAKILAEMATNDETFFGFAMRKANEHRDYFIGRQLPPDTATEFARQAEMSLAAQAALELDDEQSFEDFLNNYYQQYQFEVN